MIIDIVVGRVKPSQNEQYMQHYRRESNVDRGKLQLYT